ncbi:hypothetical protein BpHYR1_016499, partial [Brachionus plicatilis]
AAWGVHLTTQIKSIWLDMLAVINRRLVAINFTITLITMVIDLSIIKKQTLDSKRRLTVRGMTWYAISAINAAMLKKTASLSIKTKVTKEITRRSMRQTLYQQVNHQPMKMKCNMAAEGKLLTSRGLIDGKPMKIAYDCGATVSIFSNKMIDKHVMETIPTNKKVKIADNSVLKIDKMTKKLEVNISGHICFLEFWVIDNQENDALLNRCWSLSKSKYNYIPKRNDNLRFRFE